MNIGIGHSERIDPEGAGREAGHAALATLDTEPGIVLAFCGGRHDGHAFLRGLRGALGSLPIVGGSSVGAMSGSMLGATGFECAVALLPDCLQITTIAATGPLHHNEHRCGEQLAERLLPSLGEGASVLLFYDSVAVEETAELHVASRLVQGLRDGFATGGAIPEPKLIGAGMLADLDMGAGFVFDGEGTRRHAAVAIVLPGSIHVETLTMHGCVPASAFHEITRIDGAEVFELDNQPAIQVLADALDIPPAELMQQKISLALTLGEKQGDPYAPFDESHYINRLVASADPERGSVTLFEADFAQGTRVQLMVTDAERMCDSVEARTRDLLSGAAPAADFALYIDCAGRSSLFNGAPIDEASIVQDRLEAKGIPWLGFYSGVEIAPLLGCSRPLDWTGVLTVVRAAAMEQVRHQGATAWPAQ